MDEKSFVLRFSRRGEKKRRCILVAELGTDCREHRALATLSQMEKLR